ncbi:hypothetical protein SAMN05444387_3870 [Flavobacterium pectinovorum]|uniref:Uncharacterized protein n=1 Tax=Flavobacterium pectinovorum TaxID=29533 RepID=A0ABY1J7M4_9FLAO|nr:hypothetical protein SAMN05444387_3870 [Flavobacterium pectinovorum]
MDNIIFLKNCNKKPDNELSGFCFDVFTSSRLNFNAIN